MDDSPNGICGWKRIALAGALEAVVVEGIQPRRYSPWCALLWASLGIVVGCAQLRVPAIDRSGNYIFSGETTTLELPDYEQYAPKPAFAAAKTPPACVGPNCAARPCGYNPGAASPVMQLDKKPYVVVMPGRVVAPVGSEVIVASGICGGEGNYVMRQPLEWAVSPNSVGHIVQVGKNEHFLLTDWIHAKETAKFSGERAYTRTHTHRQTIDRGTPDLADDVKLGKGQSWISVTSPVEGSTFVDVVAPTVKNWEKRRQTATIYWVDGQWMFPTPQIVRVDKAEPVNLTTTVARSGLQTPIPGWIVEYEVLDGPAATFAETGKTVARATTDENGRATVQIVPESNTPGVTQVAVRVIRTSNRNGEMPELVVGQGGTSVTWSAPGLGLRVNGPPSANFDEPTTYIAEIVNVGDMDAQDVTLTYTPPDGCQVVTTNPPANAFGDRLEWRLGDVRPREAPRGVEVVVRMTAEARYSHCFAARSRDGLANEQCAQTSINRSALSVRLEGPERVPVGGEARFLATITNTGTAPIANIQLTDVFDDGLEHVMGNTSPMMLPLDRTLAPGESDTVEITFIVRREGRLCHRIDAQSRDGQTATTQACVIGSGERTTPRLTVRMEGPRRLEGTEPGLYTITVANNGNVPLTNVRVTFQSGTSIYADQASTGARRARGGREVYWDLPTLEVGPPLQFEVECYGLRSDPEAICQASVSSDEGADDTDRVATEVVRADDAGAVGPDPGVGRLDVSATPLDNSVGVGQPARLRIEATNRGSTEDNDIRIAVRLPVGMRVERVEAPGLTKEQPDRQTVLLTARSLRANERLTAVTIVVSADQAGEYTPTIEAVSARDPQGVQRTVSLQVNP